MAYLNSNNITAFPCANRGGTYNLEARLTSEYYLTNIINQLIDKTSFVISPSTTSALTANTPISFNINGYYFNVPNYQNIITLLSSEGSQPNDVYASIRVYAQPVEGYGANNTMFELVKYDTQQPVGDFPIDSGESGNTTFNGVNFTSTEPEDSSDSTNNRYSLHILHKEGSNWYVPRDSTVKFVTDNSKSSVKIDDGELT